MKTDMFSSLKVMHGAALSTALSVAASMVIAAASAMPVDVFAASTAASAKSEKSAKATKKSKKAAEPAAKVSSRASAKGAKVAAAKHDDDDDAPRAVSKKKRVSYTMNGRHRSVVRRVAFEPRSPTAGQAFGLHESPEGVALRSTVAYVVDQNTSEPVFDKNSRAVVPIASITKLMTALVVLESHPDMEAMITVTADDLDTEKFSSSRHTRLGM